ncbi:acetyl-CoA carboxylase biotin carboxyl carrier protein subunit [Pectobacterium sp. LFLA-215]|uniref:acetyl-CoA carboxylase biotin carboxyl carrier protein subunit n=1 Tax=Pectobacterium sp. LFLA-215 TaxID=3419008 RepID=UPI003F5B251B
MHQRAAFEAERERWRIAGQSVTDSVDVVIEEASEAPILPGQVGVASPISGNLWQVTTEVGKTVAEGETLMILESMKMEIPIVSPQRGMVRDIRCQPGASVRAGQCVVVIESQAE